MDSGGLSWADQWDSHPDPSPSSDKEDKKKAKSGSEKMKNLLSFKWMKDHRRKKSEKS
ncbi:uncharacterized protein G2W53_008317 [Senna tora]|uniref:Uncharacterized protein n=1 Tax=Senna tora TaxID=362788 RepID=A0A835CGV7_9FABA|nr:uncharacterized protein G2W53_008317 [Senna tora]